MFITVKFVTQSIYQFLVIVQSNIIKHLLNLKVVFTMNLATKTIFIKNSYDKPNDKASDNKANNSGLTTK